MRESDRPELHLSEGAIARERRRMAADDARAALPREPVQPLPKAGETYHTRPHHHHQPGDVAGETEQTA